MRIISILQKGIASKCHSPKTVDASKQNHPFEKQIQAFLNFTHLQDNIVNHARNLINIVSKIALTS